MVPVDLSRVLYANSVAWQALDVGPLKWPGRFSLTGQPMCFLLISDMTLLKKMAGFSCR
jgi:hypothetical protein